MSARTSESKSRSNYERACRPDVPGDESQGARELGVIAITPSVPTHLGMVNSITDFGEILEDSMEEHRIGHLDDLTNEEFNQVFTAAQNFCQRMTATAASK